MARYGKVGAAPRIVVLLLLLLVLLLGGLLWFDYLGIVNVRDTIAPVLRLLGIPGAAPVEAVEDPFLLDRQRLGMQEEALLLREEELAQRTAELDARETELESLAATLEEMEQSLNDRENSLNERIREYENRNANLARIAQYLTGMPPQSAVEILAEMEDQNVIEIFRAVEQLAAQAGEDSIVPFWLSLIPPERAATLKRKMIERPGD